MYVCLVWFETVSTILSYLMPNLFYTYRLNSSLIFKTILSSFFLIVK